MGDAAKEYVAGFAAGIATVVTGHPFDTIKVKLQTHNTEASGKKYKNALHCASKILSSEGVRGLYRGATSSFVGMAFESSLFFGMYSQLKKTLQGEMSSSRPQIQVVVPSAGCSGAIISLILCPAELVKCRMQVYGMDLANTKYNRYNGPLDCAVTTIKTEGIKGIFRGYYATILRESIGNAVFFSTYEYTRYFMHTKIGSALNHLSEQPKALINVGIGIVSGGLSGIADLVTRKTIGSACERGFIIWTATYQIIRYMHYTQAIHLYSGILDKFWSAVLPLDVAKTVIQTSPTIESTADPFRTLISIYRRVGLRGCYAGLGPTLVRAFPANAAAIVTWEFAAKVLDIKRD
ncbi:mitochondrial arginine transporter BAC1 isoform X1 [Aristolochia californica]|uniref:mitochondrial arginine transporter BAC1 isoform X1 n=1 Tax=Aristolochia californica TaxID=171875 RepID=UPI0035D9083F